MLFWRASLYCKTIYEWGVSGHHHNLVPEILEGKASHPLYEYHPCGGHLDRIVQLFGDV
jgi:hypothetical protein